MATGYTVCDLAMKALSYNSKSHFISFVFVHLSDREGFFFLLFFFQIKNPKKADRCSDISEA